MIDGWHRSVFRGLIESPWPSLDDLPLWSLVSGFAYSCLLDAIVVWLRATVPSSLLSLFLTLELGRRELTTMPFRNVPARVSCPAAASANDRSPSALPNER
ncbi:uncharacterized protein K489DRAFT_228106 [Dissoconium aciculare CBS 342.82]|uniref:Uncharacterized protein n=1 Tax=Dissoconium aciculare CBS 342.82 TaxID=1314786 RepID=A0A6J3M317_9PEZI|nr:uncharacterized protein K489DRAFT_228106 [Dissoconium aciculare CBS 342.82]KAF1821904.1 hypothetical protein K489DRAFT_228106 [Dissoconium aciculare CBS 342.82]